MTKLSTRKMLDAAITGLITGWAIIGLLALLILTQGCAVQHVAAAHDSTLPAGVSHAQWDGKVWSCPARTDTYVDEHEALSGRQDFVYCVPQTPSEIEGITPDDGQTDVPLPPTQQSTPQWPPTERLDRI